MLSDIHVCLCSKTDSYITNPQRYNICYKDPFETS